MRARHATTADAADIARIYNQGLEERASTFEVRLRTMDDVLRWFDGKHPIVVVEDDDGVIAFGATAAYRPRTCYDGVAEVSLYVERLHRKRGAGRLALTELICACEEAGYWKLVARIFPDNAGSRALIKALGFREVGVYEKHGRLDGVWRDVVIVERLIAANTED